MEFYSVNFLGYRWHIGTGNQINVWTDLRSNIVPLRAITHTLPQLQGLKVSHLFDPVTNSWRYDLVNFILNQKDANAVLQMSLNSRSDTDSIIWTATSDGQYSIIRQPITFACKLCLKATAWLLKVIRGLYGSSTFLQK